jgi:YD repeat-containing protein
MHGGDNGYNEKGEKINDNGGDTTDYKYDKDGNIISSTAVHSRAVSQGQYREDGSFRTYGNNGFPMATGAISEDNSFVGGFVSGKALNLVGKGFTAFTGGLKQWFRYGPSYSRALGTPISKSIRWGASPKYSSKIGNQTLREVNQSFRQTKLPGNNWRVNDSGHFHLKK